MMNFITEWLMNGWIGDNLRQALADGYFASGEEISYFAEYVFAPMFVVFLFHALIILFFTVWLCRFSFLLVDLLYAPIRQIYYRLRYGRVIHLYSPEKEVKSSHHSNP